MGDKVERVVPGDSQKSLVMKRPELTSLATQPGKISLHGF